MNDSFNGVTYKVHNHETGDIDTILWWPYKVIGIAWVIVLLSLPFVS